MPSIERKITVLEPSYIKPIHIVQNSNLQTIEITVTDWNIPSDAVVYWQVANGGEGEIDLAVINGNTIIFQPFTTTFANVGETYLQARIIYESRLLVTFEIPVYIEHDRVGSSAQGGENHDVIAVMVQKYVDEFAEGLFERLEAKAEETIESIPDDYAELNNRIQNYLAMEFEVVVDENGNATFERADLVNTEEVNY